jgi:hypothetical protein
MVRRRSRIALLGVCISLLSVLPAQPDEMAPGTREMLETIVAGYRDNRARITDLTISGNLRIVMNPTTSTGGEGYAYQFFQSGEKKRVDQTYPVETHDYARRGRTWMCVYTGNATLGYLGGTKPQMITAEVLKPGEFEYRTDIVLLDTLKVARNCHSHVEWIDHFLKRWDPQKDKFTVETVEKEGLTLLQVIYESTRGGPSQFMWYFDPQRGYEAVEAASSVSRPDGTLVSKSRASYEIREVAPAVWRATGVDLQEDNLAEDGSQTAAQVRLQATSVAANTGTVADRLFTFHGLGLQPGTIVIDRTLNPPVTYQFALNLLPRLEQALADAYAASNNAIPDTNLAEQGRITPADGPFGEERNREIGGTPESVRWHDRIGATVHTGFWTGLVFGVSVFTGWLIFRVCRTSPARGRTKLGVILALLATLTFAPHKAIGAESSSSLALHKELNLYPDEGRMCGAVALYYVLREVGRPVSFLEIMAQVPISARGTSMSDLCSYLTGRKVAYQVVKPRDTLTVTRVLQPGVRAAILHADQSSHFLVARKTGQGCLVILDGRRAITEDTARELARRFSGTVLIVGLTRPDLVRQFVDWRRMFVVVGVIPFGVGIGAFAGHHRKKGGLDYDN